MVHSLPQLPTPSSSAGGTPNSSCSVAAPQFPLLLCKVPAMLSAGASHQVKQPVACARCQAIQWQTLHGLRPCIGDCSSFTEILLSVGCVWLVSYADVAAE
jgi:hypothetical protein